MEARKSNMKKYKNKIIEVSDFKKNQIDAKNLNSSGLQQAIKASNPCKKNNLFLESDLLPIR